MSDSYASEPLAPFRQLVIDGMSLGARKHNVHGLIEVDITAARARIQEIKAQAAGLAEFGECGIGFHVGITVSGK